VITNIQFLRAFAALSVVIYHTNFYFRGMIRTEFGGIAIFFVISGFIMTYISRRDSSHFFLKRCIRIVPVYFLLTLAIFLIFKGYTLDALLKSLLFIPYINSGGDWHPIIRVGWTLNLEMYFYILYSAALLISIRYAPAIVSMTILSFNIFSDFDSDSLLSFYTHQDTTYFILGIASYYIWRAIDTKQENDSAKTFVISGASVSIIFFFVWHLSPEFEMLFREPFRTIVAYLLPFIIVFTALMLHSVNLRCKWKPALIIGEASYALYLVHTLIFGTLAVMGYNVHTQSVVNMLMLVSLCLPSSIILHYAFERPAKNYLRDYFQKRFSI